MTSAMRDLMGASQLRERDPSVLPAGGPRLERSCVLPGARTCGIAPLAMKQASDREGAALSDATRRERADTEARETRHTGRRRVLAGLGVFVLVVVIGLGVAWWRLKDHGLSGLMLASALSLYATFLVGWQAFVNYYYFVGALLILAALIRANTKAATA